MDKSKLGSSTPSPSSTESSSSNLWLDQLAEIKRKSASNVASLAQKDDQIAQLREQLAASQNQVENQAQQILGYERLKTELRHQVELSDAEAFSMKKDNINLNIEVEEVKKEVKKWSMVATKKGVELEAAQNRIKELEKELQDLKKEINAVSQVISGEEVGVPDIMLEGIREADEAPNSDQDDEDDGAPTDVELEESPLVANFSPISPRTERCVAQRSVFTAVSTASGILPIATEYKSEVVPSISSFHGTGLKPQDLSRLLNGRFKSEIRNDPVSASQRRRELAMANNLVGVGSSGDDSGEGARLARESKSVSSSDTGTRRRQAMSTSPPRQLRKRSKVLFYSVLEGSDSDN